MTDVRNDEEPEDFPLKYQLANGIVWLNALSRERLESMPLTIDITSPAYVCICNGSRRPLLADTSRSFHSRPGSTARTSASGMCSSTVSSSHRSCSGSLIDSSRFGHAICCWATVQQQQQQLLTERGTVLRPRGNPIVSQASATERHARCLPCDTTAIAHTARASLDH